MVKATKFVVLSVVLICLLAISCSKKSDPGPTYGCLITKSVLSYSGGSQAALYEYDGNGILTKYTLTIANTGSPTLVEVFTYAYANGAVSSVTQAIQGGATTMATWTVDASRRVIKIVINGTPGGESNYTYDGDNNFKSLVSKSGSSTNTVTAQFGSGQLQSFTQDVNTPHITINNPYTFSGFDSKNNPWSLLATATGQKFFTTTIYGDVRPEFLFTSNPTKDEFDYRTNGGQNDHGSDTYTYEYNAKNYPTKITRVQAGATPVVTTFEYSNCN